MSNRTHDTRSLDEIFTSIYATLGFDYKADEQRRIRILMELAHHGVMVHDDWVYDTNYLHDKLSMVVQTNRMMGQRVLNYTYYPLECDIPRKEAARDIMGYYPDENPKPFRVRTEEERIRDYKARYGETFDEQQIRRAKEFKWIDYGVYSEEIGRMNI